MDYTTTVESRYWYDAELAVIYKHLGKTELVDSLRNRALKSSRPLFEILCVQSYIPGFAGGW